MTRWKEAAVVALLVMVTGCAGNNLQDTLLGTDDYHMTVNSTGDLVLNNVDFGTFPLPRILAGPLVTAVSGQLRKTLEEKYQRGDCLLESHGAKPEGRAILWSGSALCLHQGQRETIVLAVKLEPVVEG